MLIKIDCACFLEYTSVKDGLIDSKCLCCNNNYKKKFDENLKNRFANTYKFSNYNINKFVLLLRKGVNPYEHMDDWGNSMKRYYPKEKIFIAI